MQRKEKALLEISNGFNVHVTLEYLLTEPVHACLSAASHVCEQLLQHATLPLAARLTEQDLLDEETLRHFRDQLNRMPAPCKLHITVSGMVVQYTILSIFQHCLHLSADERKELGLTATDVVEGLSAETQQQVHSLLEETEARLSENERYQLVKAKLSQILE